MRQKRLILNCNNSINSNIWPADFAAFAAFYAYCACFNPIVEFILWQLSNRLKAKFHCEIEEFEEICEHSATSSLLAAMQIIGNITLIAVFIAISAFSTLRLINV